MLSALLALSLVADAGPGTTYARQLLNDVFRAQQQEQAKQRQDAIAALKLAAAAATGPDRKLVDRMLRFLEADPPRDQAYVELSDIVRELLKISRGRFDEERAAHGAFLSLPMLAESLGKDPGPIRKEAVERTRDLAARYPNEGVAHGLLASALQAARADPKDWLPPLTKCAELAPTSWCTEHRRQLLNELTRPRCAGAKLKQPLTASGENEKPFLEAKDFASVGVDADGNLALETTAAARATLEAETRRRIGKNVVLKLGSEVLLSAMVQEAIKEGRIRVTPGKGRTFRLDELCAAVERPLPP